MHERWLALVGVISGDRRAAQTAGYPLDPSKMLPLPDVVLLVADNEPGAMLFRYTAHGEFGGDTWHPSADDAREQAADEYGDALSEWIEVPSDISEPHAFAVQFAYERLNGRGDW
jgi:basic membrane lipoprotein Med (substrate-binding protein (PBP1-ABC) superfamily)